MKSLNLVSPRSLSLILLGALALTAVPVTGLAEMKRVSALPSAAQPRSEAAGPAEDILLTDSDEIEARMMKLSADSSLEFMNRALAECADLEDPASLACERRILDGLEARAKAEAAKPLPPKVRAKRKARRDRAA